MINNKKCRRKTIFCRCHMYVHIFGRHTKNYLLFSFFCIKLFTKEEKVVSFWLLLKTNQKCISINCETMNTYGKSSSKKNLMYEDIMLDILDPVPRSRSLSLSQKKLSFRTKKNVYKHR